MGTRRHRHQNVIAVTVAAVVALMTLMGAVPVSAAPTSDTTTLVNSLPAAVNSEQRLQPNTVYLLRLVEHMWPYYRNGGNIYGWRHDAVNDHPSGQALDIMMPGSARNPDEVAFGNTIAAFLTTNADTLGVTYMVWRQHIWYPGQQWRLMDDRHDWTHNHMDHIHVLVDGQHSPGGPLVTVSGSGLGLPDPVALLARRKELSAAVQQADQHRRAVAARCVSLKDAQAANTHASTSATMVLARAVREAYMTGVEPGIVLQVETLSSPDMASFTAAQVGLNRSLNAQNMAVEQALRQVRTATEHTQACATEEKTAADAHAAAVQQLKEFSAAPTTS